MEEFKLFIYLLCINIIWIWGYLEYLYIKNGHLGIFIVNNYTDKIDFYFNNLFIFVLSLIPALTLSAFLMLVYNYTKTLLLALLALLIVKFIKDKLYNIYIKKHPEQKDKKK